MGRYMAMAESANTSLDGYISQLGSVSKVNLSGLSGNDALSSGVISAIEQAKGSISEEVEKIRSIEAQLIANAEELDRKEEEERRREEEE